MKKRVSILTLELVKKKEHIQRNDDSFDALLI